jgi:hypothetical protein
MGGEPVQLDGISKARPTMTIFPGQASVAKTTILSGLREYIYIIYNGLGLFV